MNDEWARVELGTLLTRVRRRVDVIEGVEYPAVSVARDGQGLGVKEPFVGGVTTYKTLFRIHDGDVVVRTITAFESPAAVADASHHGTHVSQVFLTYTVGPGVLPEYLRLFFQTETFWDEMRNRAQGTVLRRKTISDHDFRGIPLRLPPLSVQRRIVDLMEHLDKQVDRLRDEARALRELVVPLLASLIRSSHEVAVLPMGQVGEFIRGRRFTKKDYVPSGMGCIHYGQIHTHYGHVAAESLTFLPEDLRGRLRFAKPGDVVIAAASEDVEGLGKATVWMGDDEVAVHDDCYIFRHTLDPLFASFLFVSPWFQNRKRQYASGMKVARISGTDLSQISVPVPPMDAQCRIGTALLHLTDGADAMDTEADAVRTLGASLLGALLARERSIPDSYDDLLGVAS